MSGPETGPLPQDQLLQEAAAWFAHMRGPQAESSRNEFEAWLRRGALHRQAYNRAAEIFAMGKILAQDEDRGEPQRSDRGDGRGRARLVWATLGALLVLVTSGWLVVRALAPGEPERDRVAESEEQRAPVLQLSATAGQSRTVRLADRSQVILEGNSLLEVRLGSAERRLHLRQGRVRFEVFHERRPFIVHAGGGRIIARGTVFDVGFTADRRVTVRLLAGAVDVTFPSGAAPDRRQPGTMRLGPGQTLSYAMPSDQAQMRPAATGAPAMRSAGTAPQPPRDYDGITVANLVAAANRGAPRPIRLADTAIGERRVSGRFSIDDTNLLAERLALLFDLAIDRGHSSEIILRAR